MERTRQSTWCDFFRRTRARGRHKCRQIVVPIVPRLSQSFFCTDSIPFAQHWKLKNRLLVKIYFFNSFNSNFFFVWARLVDEAPNAYRSARVRRRIETGLVSRCNPSLYRPNPIGSGRTSRALSCTSFAPTNTPHHLIYFRVHQVTAPSPFLL